MNFIKLFLIIAEVFFYIQIPFYLATRYYSHKRYLRYEESISKDMNFKEILKGYEYAIYINSSWVALGYIALISICNVFGFSLLPFMIAFLPLGIVNVMYWFPANRKFNNFIKQNEDEDA